jgi:hypothetical protein
MTNFGSAAAEGKSIRPEQFARGPWVQEPRPRNAWDHVTARNGLMVA